MNLAAAEAQILGGAAQRACGVVADLEGNSGSAAAPDHVLIARPLNALTSLCVEPAITPFAKANTTRSHMSLMSEARQLGFCVP